MKSYVVTTGVVFGLMVLAHVARVFAEGMHVARDPFFITITVIAAAFSLWAVGLLRRASKS